MFSRILKIWYVRCGIDLYLLLTEISHNIMIVKHARIGFSVFFSSYFLPTLFEENNYDPKLANKYNYANVESWADKYCSKNSVDLFSAENLFCPYNYSQQHWGLGVIRVQKKQVQWYDSMSATMSGSRRRKVKMLMDGLVRYMYDEYVRVPKKDPPMPLDEWKLQWSTSIITSCPQQLNGKCVSCTIHSIT